MLVTNDTIILIDLFSSTIEEAEVSGSEQSTLCINKKKKNSSTTSGDQIHSTLKVKAIQETNYTLSVFIGSSVWPLFSLINIVIYGMVANKRDIHFCAMPDYVTRMLNNYLTIVIISYRNYDKDSLITIQLRKEFI